MTAEIKKLFQSNVELLDIVDKAILYFREQDYAGALELMPDVSEKMRHVIDGIVSDKEYFELVSTESLMEMLEGIVEASRAEDYVLLADLLELQLCTLLCNVQELIMKKEDDAFFFGIHVLGTVCGYDRKIKKRRHFLSGSVVRNSIKSGGIIGTGIPSGSNLLWSDDGGSGNRPWLDIFTF